jgi:hypothetical protein
MEAMEVTGVEAMELTGVEAEVEVEVMSPFLHRLTIAVLGLK